MGARVPQQDEPFPGKGFHLGLWWESNNNNEINTRSAPNMCLDQIPHFTGEQLKLKRV